MEIKQNLLSKAKHDIVLIKKAKEGDQNAFAELMGKYWNSIYFMILKMINNESDAEDLTIETFGRAFKNINQYIPNFAFSTWLFKIASNNCIDFLRKKSKKNIMINIDDYENNDYKNDKDTVNIIKSDTLNPEEVLIKNQKKIILHKLIKQLTPQYRKIIELRYFKELSYSEISEKLNINISLVKVQLFRSKTLLMKIAKETKSNYEL